MRVSQCIEQDCNDLTDSVSGRCEWHEAQAQKRMRMIRRHLGEPQPLRRLDDLLAEQGAGLGAC